MDKSRRDFIGGLGAVAVAASLSGCSGRSIRHIGRAIRAGGELAQDDESESGGETNKFLEETEFGEAIVHDGLQLTVSIATADTVAIGVLEGVGTDNVESVEERKTSSEAVTLVLPYLHVENVGQTRVEVPSPGSAYSQGEFNRVFNLRYYDEPAKSFEKVHFLPTIEKIDGETVEMYEIPDGPGLDIFPGETIQGLSGGVYELPANFDRPELSMIVREDWDTLFKWSGR